MNLLEIVSFPMPSICTCVRAAGIAWQRPEMILLGLIIRLQNDQKAQLLGPILPVAPMRHIYTYLAYLHV